MFSASGDVTNELQLRTAPVVTISLFTIVDDCNEPYDRASCATKKVTSPQNGFPITLSRSATLTLKNLTLYDFSQTNMLRF